MELLMIPFGIAAYLLGYILVMVVALSPVIIVLLLVYWAAIRIFKNEMK